MLQFNYSGLEIQIRTEFINQDMRTGTIITAIAIKVNQYTVAYFTDVHNWCTVRVSYLNWY